MKSLLQLIVFLSLNLICFGQDLVINEFMAKNNTTITDLDGDFSDWIEIYNPSNTAVQLQNYQLSDDANEINKWTFPTFTLPAYSFVLVFASGKDQTDTIELHTNFKISSSGEALFLSNNQGEIIDQTNAVNLDSDQSFGRIPDGGSQWVTFPFASPGLSNNHSNALIFSHQNAFQESPFYLKVNGLLSDSIFYTLNGDVPTNQSAVFTDSLLISRKDTVANFFSEFPTTPDQSLISYKAWESNNEKIDKATVLRCVSYKNGKPTSSIYTKTFIVDDEVSEKYSFPVISLVTEEENLFNQDTGIYVPGVNFDSSNPEWTGNYFMSGKAWERNVHIEYFENDGSIAFSQDAGLRIHGGKTRQAAQKSLRLYARKDYGKKYFNHKVFPQKDVFQFKRLMLRTTMGSWGKETIIKDVLAHNIVDSLNIDYQDYQPVVVYLNGEYWGIHTIRDRIDERYIGYTHNIDKDDVEFKGWSHPEYTGLLQYIDNNDLSQAVHYDYVKSKMAIENYIDYNIAEQFLGNYDWPDNNVKLWKNKNNGKWRWIFYDLDAGFGNPIINMLNHSTYYDSTATYPDVESSTFLFRNLLKNQDFVNQYLSRYKELLKTVFDIYATESKYDELLKLYRPEIKDHISRWNYPESKSKWEEDVQMELLTFLEERACLVKENLINFFELSHFDYHCFTKKQIAEKKVKMFLAPNPNDGRFYLFNSLEDIENATVEITDMKGQSVYKSTDVYFKKNTKITFDLAHFPHQSYFVNFYSNVYSEQFKMLIVR